MWRQVIWYRQLCFLYSVERLERTRKEKAPWEGGGGGLSIHLCLHNNNGYNQQCSISLDANRIIKPQTAEWCEAYSRIQ